MKVKAWGLISGDVVATVGIIYGCMIMGVCRKNPKIINFVIDGNIKLTYIISIKLTIKNAYMHIYMHICSFICICIYT